jgi:cytochrome c oxidase assembly protein subunit 15
LSPSQRRTVGAWLLTCAGACWGAVTIGGLTRLTESGLSITQWNVIKGMRPPLTEDEWTHEFDLYKQFPEYKL